MKFDKAQFKKDLHVKLRRQFGADIKTASKRDIFEAVSSCVMDLIMEDWVATRDKEVSKEMRRVYYMSAEFLMGRAFSNNIVNAGIKGEIVEVLKELDVDYNLVEEQEPDAGLGNGGLGRLAACFMDSLATLDYPAMGYGIRYEYGMFEQHIENGSQVEYPDVWLSRTDPWEIKREDLQVKVKFGNWLGEVVATPYDMPIIGYGTKTIDTLRLWEASSSNGFNLQLFNDMRYHDAVIRKNDAENISRVLYPNDNGPEGKTLRLMQQYFFTSASLQDMIRSFTAKHGNDFAMFPKLHVIQLNDTHPVVAIPELMRILMDEYSLGWDESWQIVQKTFAYTNHTILAEALEKWPIDIFQGLIPRIYEIVEEINRRFAIELQEKFPGDYNRHHRMSIIHDGKVYMAWLAIHAGYSVNGVAALHTELLKTQELKDWYELYPQKFNNKTNGITQRRWLLLANPQLAEFITKRIGDGWQKDLSLLKGLEKYVDDKKSLEELNEIKYNNKKELSKYLRNTQNEFLDPESIFDVQVKRLHEYKRQLLNIMHIMYLYNKLLENPGMDMPARTFIFGAKAASGYRRAKSIIELIHAVAKKINNDSRIGGKIRVVFVQNYRVSAAEKIIPAADVSEQISTAGLEASGTSNMKFMCNGALTLGTMDGANIEIVEEAGKENAFIFGLTSDEIIKIQNEHSYNPRQVAESNPDLMKVLNQFVDGTYDETHNKFRELYDSLLNGVEGQRPDVYYLLADFQSYCDAQEKIAKAYADRLGWAKSALINIANSGKFSSDRTIEDYVKDIWKLKKL